MKRIANHRALCWAECRGWALAHDPVDVAAERRVHQMKERDLVIVALALAGFSAVAFVMLRPPSLVPPVAREQALQIEAAAWNSKADQMREDRAARELSENRAQDAQRRAVFDRCIETAADTIAGCARRAESR